MSQEQALQDSGSTAQQDQHSDDAGLYSEDAPSKPTPVQYGSFAAQQNLHADDANLYSDDAPTTPVTVKAISPEPEGSPSRLDLDSTLGKLSGDKTEKSVWTESGNGPESSSEPEAQRAEDDENVESKERDDIPRIVMDDNSNDAVEEDDNGDLVYTQPPRTIIPKTRFTEVFFAPQGDPALIPPVSGRESHYHARPATISDLATTEPRPVPHDLYWKVLRSGYAELPVGPGFDGFYPSARDLVAMTQHVQKVPLACMAERIRNYMKAVEEKSSVIEELGKALKNPNSVAQSTEIGTLKGSNKYLEDQIQTITNHYEQGRLKHESELERLQADIKIAIEDRQRAQARFELYERQIVAKDNTIAKLRALLKDAAPNGTIVSPTNKSGIPSRFKSLQVYRQMAARNEVTISRLQNEVIKSQTKDMTEAEADTVDKALRAEYAREKLKDEVKDLKTEVDEQRTTITLYEERLRDQEAQIQRLQLEKAQHAQDIRAAEKRITEYISKELTLTKDKTSLIDRVKVLNEEVKDRSKELKESDQQLTLVRRGHAATLNESARLKDEIQKVTHERAMLKTSLAQAGNWQQEKYTANLTSEELKQELAALKEDTGRMVDRYRFQIENLEITTREKIKNERKEAERKRRKVQEKLVALRGRALTNPSEAESEQDIDSASAVNGGKSLEEELNGSSSSDECSPIEEVTGVVTNGSSHTQAASSGTQDRPSQNTPPYLSNHSKYSEQRITPQLEGGILSSAEDETPNMARRILTRPLVGLDRPWLIHDLEIPRPVEQNIDGAARPEGDSTVSQQSILNVDNEVHQKGESEAHRQRLPYFEARPRPEEGSKAPQQRPPTLNEQALQEGGFSTRRRNTPILNVHLPSVRKSREPSPTRLDLHDQERPMTASNQLYETLWVKGLKPSQEHHETEKPSGQPVPPPDEAETETTDEIIRTDSVRTAKTPQEQHETADQYSDSQEQPTTTAGGIYGMDWVRSLIPQEQHDTADQYSDSQEQPTTTAGGIYGTDWVRSLIPQENHETADPSGPAGSPSAEVGAETDPPQELGQARDGHPPSPPSGSSSGADSPPPGGGGEGPRDRRPRAPVIIPVYERVPYGQDPYRLEIRFGKWEKLVWFLVALFLLATFLMFMSLREEKQRWLAANEGTRQMLFSVQRGGGAGTGLLTWLLGNGGVDLETTSYG